MDKIMLITELEIVNKVWGQEQIIVNTEKFAGKKMYLSEQHQCSYHFHYKKTESFYIQEGIILLTVNSRQFLMYPDQVLHLSVYDAHSFLGITDSIFFEFSTYDSPKDNYRFTNSRKLTDEEFKKVIEKWTSNKQ